MIDSHVHLWDPVALRYPWLADVPALDRAFLPGDLDPTGHQVDGLIVVEAGCLDGSAELDWLTRLAEAWPVIAGVVVHAPVELGPGVGPLLAAAAQNPLTVGVRRNVQDESAGFLLAPLMVEGVRELARHRLPFDACVREHQLRELIGLVDRCPDVTFVLDHLGKPAIGPGRGQPWFDDAAALAKRPNVVAKLSGLATEAGADWQSTQILPYLRHAIEAFGPQRCMFGGDWPVATLATTYDRWLDVVAEATAELSAADRSEVFNDTAGRTYVRAVRNT